MSLSDRAPTPLIDAYHTNLKIGMSKDGYISISDDTSINGVCYGSASVAGLYILSNKVSLFNEALQLANDYSLDTNIKNKDNALTLRGFFENIIIFQNPAGYNVLLNQLSGDAIQNFLRIANMLPTKKIEEEKGVVCLANKTFIADAEVLFDLFDELIEITNQHNTLSKPCIFMLGDANHGIIIGYNPSDEIWYGMDINQGVLREFNDINEMVGSIILSFSDQPFAMSMQMFVTGIGADEWKDVVSTWQEGLAWFSLPQNVHFIDAKKDSLLHRAILSNNKKDVKLYIKHGADINYKDSLGYTPLINAIMVNNEKMITLLLVTKGVDINYGDNDGLTPLYCAVVYNSIWLVRLLLRHGADKNKKDNNGNTPLSIAYKHNNISLFQLMLDDKNDCYFPVAGLSSNFDAAINEIAEVRRQIYVNQPYAKGNTLLHFAVKQKNTAFIELLLTYNANIFQLNDERMTPIDIAANMRSFACLNLLLIHAACVVPQLYSSPFDYAQKHNNHEFAEWLRNNDLISQPEKMNHSDGNNTFFRKRKIDDNNRDNKLKLLKK